MACMWVEKLHFHAFFTPMNDTPHTFLNLIEEEPTLHTATAVSPACSASSSSGPAAAVAAEDEESGDKSVCLVLQIGPPSSQDSMPTASCTTSTNQDRGGGDDAGAIDHNRVIDNGGLRTDNHGGVDHNTGGLVLQGPGVNSSKVGGLSSAQIERSGPSGGRLAAGQYWIPTISQILHGFRFSCPVCSKKFNRYHTMQTHMSEHGSEHMEGLEPQRQTLPAEMMRLPCYCCVKRCNNNIDHVQAKPLNDFATLKIHYKRKHGIKTFKCQKCNQKFAFRADWRAHEENCGQLWFCVCGANFKQKRSLNKHIQKLGTGHAPRGSTERPLSPAQFQESSRTQQERG
ncbi:unnamed protein product [Calypogeia fissa]